MINRLINWYWRFSIVSLWYRLFQKTYFSSLQQQIMYNMEMTGSLFDHQMGGASWNWEKVVVSFYKIDINVIGKTVLPSSSCHYYYNATLVIYKYTYSRTHTHTHTHTPSQVSFRHTTSPSVRGWVFSPTNTKPTCITLTTSTVTEEERKYLGKALLTALPRA